MFRQKNPTTSSIAASIKKRPEMKMHHSTKIVYDNNYDERIFRRSSTRHTAIVLLSLLLILPFVLFQEWRYLLVFKSISPEMGEYDNGQDSLLPKQNGSTSKLFSDSYRKKDDVQQKVQYQMNYSTKMNPFQRVIY